MQGSRPVGSRNKFGMTFRTVFFKSLMLRYSKHWRAGLTRMSIRQPADDIWAKGGRDLSALNS